MSQTQTRSPTLNVNINLRTVGSEDQGVTQYRQLDPTESFSGGPSSTGRALSDRPETLECRSGSGFCRADESKVPEDTETQGCCQFCTLFISIYFTQCILYLSKSNIFLYSMYMHTYYIHSSFKGHRTFL